MSGRGAHIGAPLPGRDARMAVASSRVVDPPPLPGLASCELGGDGGSPGGQQWAHERGELTDAEARAARADG